MGDARRALVDVGRALARAGYRFVTVSPATHARVVRRAGLAEDLRDVFGWSLPFRRDLLDREWLERLEAAGACADRGDGIVASRVRYATLGGSLYVHSAYPTVERDAVFFGPDTYRFADFVARHAPAARHVVDVGCGAGAGGIVAARVSGASTLTLTDLNPRAALHAEVSAELAGAPARCVVGDGLERVDGAPDLVVSNPPYMRDPGGRLYRDGGGATGEAASVRITREALARLAPGGTLLVYTGSAIERGGRDAFFEAVRPHLAGHRHAYEEIDPDVFGETLDEAAYAGVERIAAVGLRVQKSSRRSADRPHPQPG